VVRVGYSGIRGLIFLPWFLIPGPVGGEGGGRKKREKWEEAFWWQKEGEKI
jgi:hypothetical protein